MGRNASQSCSSGATESPATTRCTASETEPRQRSWRSFKITAATTTVSAKMDCWRPSWSPVRRPRLSAASDTPRVRRSQGLGAPSRRQTNFVSVTSQTLVMNLQFGIEEKWLQKSRQELFECQTAEQYEQIGRFVVEFEQACSWLRIGIIFSLHHDGLRTQRLAQILIDNTVMTAAPLIKAYDAIMTEIGVREDPVQKEVLDQVSKEFHELTSERNKLFTDFGS